MNVYIKSLNGFPLFDMGVTALQGFRANGTNVILYEDLDEVPLNRYTLLVTSIEETQEWFRRMKWYEHPELETIPIELDTIDCTQRKIKFTTLKEVRDMKEGFPIFVKPINLKQFNAGIIHNIHQIEWIESHLPDKTPIIISEVKNIISEYRCYVIEGKCVGIYNYLGDIYEFPNPNIIELMINRFKSAPVAYSLDVGIVEDPKEDENYTILIECNDFWSLGNYGLSPKLYCRGLMLRWRQLLELNKI